ncbi:hypothetical protein A1O1_03074 [Capronia coronata CBS 617.96]|uniref:RecQ-mediated genome instability protein 1 n=1 Tax=Capronia coronata CBS 617.96 TaxID=1182541 RepID=W9YP11_9EURO|nr:uncharacterized protein A1O1_03074 [Capronia coronata CBS 617.96]EXJ94677.1 hypothetical protein A1O1_03074 [Capronia coronata CBS 617.96]
MSTPHPLHTQLSTSLQIRHNLPVNPQWLTDFLSSRGPTPPPFPALLSTAHFRILASDITTSLRPVSAGDVLPPDVSDVNVKERRLAGTVIVQVLDVLDVGSSKWSQVEAIERVENGEEIRGREVIRTVDVMEEGDDGSGGIDPAATSGGGVGARPSGRTNGTTATTTTSTATANSGYAANPNKLSLGPHKLLLQDARGTKVLAFELVRVPGIGLSISASAARPSATSNGARANTIPTEDPGMFIGCKILLKPGTVVRRGMAMLTPENCVLLGGKLEAWDRKWKEERKQRLIAMLGEENGAAVRG